MIRLSLPRRVAAGAAWRPFSAAPSSVASVPQGGEQPSPAAGAAAGAADVQRQFHPTLQQRLSDAGIESLFPVQEETFSLAAQGRDMFVRSRTGSGKTLGFALPIVDAILRARDETGRAPRPRAPPTGLILAPTRELANQISQEISRIGGGVRVVSLYGGTPKGPQIRSLRDGCDVVVGCPGRVIDLMEEGVLRLDAVRRAVLDEADEMLRMGFADDVEHIFGSLPDGVDRWTSMWSATKPAWVAGLARKYLGADAEHLDLGEQSSSRLPPTIDHRCIMVTEKNRNASLAAIVASHMNADAAALAADAADGAADNAAAAAEELSTAIVFVNTKRDAAALAQSNLLRPLGAAALHGDMGQAERDVAMKAFRSGECRVLVATDVAARGLDVPHITLVVHHTLPPDAENFVHRSGRTGRAGRSGTNVALCTVREHAALRGLEAKFGFRASQEAPPARSALAETLGAAMARELSARVAADDAEPFREEARRAIERSGGDAEGVLASALSKLCPLPGVAEHHSAVDGWANRRTVAVGGAKKVSAALGGLRELLGPDVDTRNEYLFEGGVVLDLWQRDAARLLTVEPEDRPHSLRSVAPIDRLPRVFRDKRHRVNRNFSGPAWQHGGRGRGGGRRDAHFDGRRGGRGRGDGAGGRYRGWSDFGDRRGAHGRSSFDDRNDRNDRRRRGRRDRRGGGPGGGRHRGGFRDLGGGGSDWF